MKGLNIAILRPVFPGLCPRTTTASTLRRVAVFAANCKTAASAKDVDFCLLPGSFLSDHWKEQVFSTISNNTHVGPQPASSTQTVAAPRIEIFNIATPRPVFGALAHEQPRHRTWRCRLITGKNKFL
jgi:hypothetical protein